jgi:hypothetical protein
MGDWAIGRWGENKTRGIGDTETRNKRSYMIYLPFAESPPLPLPPSPCPNFLHGMEAKIR